MTSIEARINEIESRLRAVEDELAITRLIASYGPLVDAGCADEVASLWAMDGDYDVEGLYMESRHDVRAMVQSAGHRHLIEGGCAHFLGPAAVKINGEEALAVCESLLVRHRDGEWSVRRAGANRMHLWRGPEGWQITHRTTRALDGSETSRSLLEELAHWPSGPGKR